jgi:hypothetical protein
MGITCGKRGFEVRRAAKIDNNQREIVRDLRKIPGITVAVGHDDILVGHKGKNYWFECNSHENVSKATGKVRESSIKTSQLHLQDTWAGHYAIVWNIEQILEALDG